jgi:GntR family transcriptional regulator
MAFDFNISPGGGSPIFRQIVDQVRLGIVTRRLAPGNQLPSVRVLAERLLVNPNTIAKAYAELVREGVIDAQQGRGVFIAPFRQVYTKPERVRRLSPLIEAVVNEALSLGFSAGELIESIEQRLAKVNVQSPSQRKTS